MRDRFKFESYQVVASYKMLKSSEQSHSNIHGIYLHYIIKETKTNVNDTIRTSVLQLIIYKHQSKCENNSAAINTVFIIVELVSC